MRVLHSWLQRFVQIDISPAKVAEGLSMLGIEIENYTDLAERYRDFVVGEVIDCTRHPNADKLSVCMVNVGQEQLQIVCGAPNVEVGQKVAVGLIGATVPRNQHDSSGKPFVLSKVKIRGVESSGMICSEFELDLGNDSNRILVLDANARVGQKISSLIGSEDTVYDVEITPNRPDWLSHIGIAREIAILTGKRFRVPEVSLPRGGTSISRRLSISVKDQVNCLRFSARMISGVIIGPSPAWLQTALRNIGLRPINNIVDITNYVMMETGHPLHAFDYALLNGRKLVIQQAKTGERFSTLDGREHILPDGAVLVCDGERPVSIAGIMGGANSEINDNTVDIVLEGAYWLPKSIRKTSRGLGISTDASYRFERGADPNMTMYAINRAAELVLETAGGDLLRGSIDVYPKRVRPRKIGLRTKRANHVLGTGFTHGQVKKTLHSLGIGELGKKGDHHYYSVPTFRVDIEREIDLIEEIARVQGYDKIPEKGSASISFTHPFPNYNDADLLRSRLVGAGYQEAVTNPLYSSSRAALTSREHIKILDPQNKGMEYLRTTLVIGLLESAARNINYGNKDLRLFEIGHVFSLKEPSDSDSSPFGEKEHVSLLLSGLRDPKTWTSPEVPVSIFDLKGEVEGLSGLAGLDKGGLIYYSTSEGLTEQALAIDINGSYAGYLGRVRGDVLKSLGIDEEVFVAELAVDRLLISKVKKYEAVSRYPTVHRDVAFVVSQDVSSGELEKSIWESGSNLLRDVTLFDLYRGDKLQEGQKSLAYSLSLMSNERTLTEKEIEEELNRIVRNAENSVGAVLRTF